MKMNRSLTIKTMTVLKNGMLGKRYSTMTEQDRYTELYETWCRVDLINLIIKLEQEKRSKHNA